MQGCSSQDAQNIQGLLAEFNQKIKFDRFNAHILTEEAKQAIKAIEVLVDAIKIEDYPSLAAVLKPVLFSLS